ncbi:MAG: VOC family protein [Pseudomonadota bacterium]
MTQTKMISDFSIVLMTRHLHEQASFYQNTLGLALIFDNQDTIGLGRDKRLFVILRKDTAEDSHHLAEQKGPVIMTFKCQGDIDDTIKKIKDDGYKVRDTLKLLEHNAHYLFIEDYDGNEICLDFPCASGKDA